MDVSTPLRDFPGVGEARAKALARLGLHTAGDLAGYFPRSYEDRRERYTIAGAPLDRPVCIEVLLTEEPRLMNIRRGLDVTRMKVADHTAAMLVSFFNQGYLRQALHRGEAYILYGKVEQMGNHRQMTNPHFEPAGRPRFTGRIMPVYPLTAGITNHFLAGLVEEALAGLPPVAEPLPEDFRARYHLAGAAESYRAIHFPRSEEDLDAARQRFAFEELFYLSLGLGLLRERRSRGAGPVWPEADPAGFYGLLPFSLTAAQRRAVEEAAADLRAPRPMNRLVQGDVGSGKTAVAAACAWMAHQAGWQSAMMAPTELLAQQHFRTLTALLEPAHMAVGLLTGSMRAAEKREVLAALRSGDLHLVVGTHALLSQGVEFRRLGLVITDEQHRFGVEQRAAFAAKANTPGDPPQAGRRFWGEGGGDLLPAAANEIHGAPSAACRAGEVEQRAAFAARANTPGDPPQAGRRFCGEGGGDLLPAAANEIHGAPSAACRAGEVEQRAAFAARANTPGDPPQAGRRFCGEGGGDLLPAAANEIHGAPGAACRAGEVEQRAAFAAKANTPGDPLDITPEEGFSPNVLVMSATPIPRTLALLLYGDLDVSIIDELPPGRQPVKTFLIGESKRQRLYGFVRAQVQEGRQVYLVCPAVEENPEGAWDLKAVNEYARVLREEVFPDLRVGLVHGKLKPREKEAAMAAFAAGETDLLVSTTVIEVGVDVPNASLIVIENADRYGLSQLHQLRGRVGRGEHPAWCILISENRSPDTRARLKVLTETSDGFRIAEEDLKLRGPGDFFGDRQHGLPALRVADLNTDTRVLKEAQSAAAALLAADPDLSRPEHAPLGDRVRRIFDQDPDRFN